MELCKQREPEKLRLIVVRHHGKGIFPGASARTHCSKEKCNCPSLQITLTGLLLYFLVCKQRLWPWILILDTWNFEHLLMYQQYKQYTHNSSLSWFKKRVKTEQALTTPTSSTDRAQQVQIP